MSYLSAVCGALLRRGLKKRSGKEPTDVKVTADESEMKVKRGKVQNAEFSAVMCFSSIDFYVTDILQVNYAAKQKRPIRSIQLISVRIAYTFLKRSRFLFHSLKNTYTVQFCKQTNVKKKKKKLKFP